MSDIDHNTPVADSVGWAGLCPCGCGVFRAVLLDENEDPIALFGWRPAEWKEFMAAVVRQIGESSEEEENACRHHTPH